jgi:RNA polymerase sigma-70 factor (ECF subfamily)
MLGLGNQLKKLDVTLRRTEINGQPGALFLDREGRLISIFSLDVADGAVQTIRGIVNPDKLGHLGPLADLRALLRENRERP